MSSDLIAFQAYRQDPEVGRYQGWSVMSDTEAAAFLDEMSVATLFQPGHWCQFGIADRATDVLIGDIGVCVADDQAKAEIGFTLRGQSHGHGLGSEAVRAAIGLVLAHTAVTRVVGITDTRNIPCIRLLERVGMRRTETLSSVFRGEPCTEYVFCIASDDVER